MFKKEEDIFREMARSHGLSVDVIRGRHKTKTVNNIRRKIISGLREKTSLSFREIGMLVGGRSTSSIIRAVSQSKKNI